MEVREFTNTNSRESSIPVATACLGLPKQTARPSRYQLHLWIGAKDYAFLRDLAREEEEPVARIIRRLIRQLRTSTRVGSD